MFIPIAAGVFVVGLLALFFWKTVNMDLAGAITAALISAGLLVGLITLAIYAGRLF